MHLDLFTTLFFFTSCLIPPGCGYQYPYDGPLRRVCRSTPDVKYIDDILLNLGLLRKTSGDTLPQYYRDFFEVVNPGVRVYMIKHKPIIYMQQRQAGADTINDNLRRLANLTAPPGSDVYDRERHIDTHHGSNNRKHLHSLLLKRSKPSDYTRLIKEARYFTFVTDPIERFLKGVNECFIRAFLPEHLNWKSRRHDTLMKSGADAASDKGSIDFDRDPLPLSKKQLSKERKKYQRFVQNHQATLDTVRDILHGILTGDEEVMDAHLLVMPGVNHFYLMSNVLREFQPDFVGDFAHFLREWPVVEKLYGAHLPLRYAANHSKYKRSDGRSDPLGVMKWMRVLLTDEPTYMHALCRLFLRDYVCFDIPLPLACGDPGGKPGAGVAGMVASEFVFRGGGTGRAGFSPRWRSA